MNPRTKTNIYIGLLFALTAAVMVYFMPRTSRTHYVYHEGRPWNYELLTAPFDITVYRDSATVHHMIDSIDRNMVPIFSHEAKVPAIVAAAIANADSVSRATRTRLAATVADLYSRGIVDQGVAARIARGELPTVKFNEDNVMISYATEGFISQRDAYAYVDSVFSNHAEHNAILKIGLSRLLQPNIVPDEHANSQYRETLVQNVLAGTALVQKGERIINKGDIVDHMAYQTLLSLESQLDKNSGHDRSRATNTIVGQSIIVLIALALVYAFMTMYYRKKSRDIKQMSVIMLLMAVFFVLSVVARNYLSGGGIYVIPLAIVPVMLTVFYDSRTAFFVYVVEVMLCATVANFQLEYIFLQIAAGTAVVFSLKELSRRSELLKSAAIAFGAYLIAYVGMELMGAGTLGSVSWRMIGFFAVNALLISFAYILIFIFEKVFGMVSVVTLVELSDINTPLLRRLSMECPGTFQHSMAVSNLATDAAHRIGANVQLVRAGALYHDIGKIENPAFFTENQHGANPHNVLSPEQSAGIIIRHISDGVRMAEKAKLPRVIRDLIVQHHGLGRAKYFYTTYCNAHPDEVVDPAPFTYPGPNPQTREASLLMMADTVEAASRSLQDHSEEAIRQMVNRLIDAQVADGLHKDSPLSFRDISDIKESFVNRLRSMYHARVSYPAEVKRPAPAASASDDPNPAPAPDKSNSAPDA